MIRRLLAVATLVFAAGWFFVLRPTVLGGPTSYILVSGQSMEPTIHAGSLVIAQRLSAYQPGQIVAYRIPRGDPASGRNVIHRIVGGSAEAGFVMRGDNTNAADLWRPRADDVLGTAVVVIPGVMPLLLFVRSPIVLASIAAAVSVYLALEMWAPAPPKRRPLEGRRSA